MKRARSAARAFREALHQEPARKKPEVRPDPAAQPEPPASPSWLDKGELPESYGRTKVVAMVVSPYMVHVYWDLSVKDGARTDPASLRFHDAGGSESFDVKVDLATKNWYVHLWSPEKRYYVELGVDHAGDFAALARSNTVETPRAWPVAEIREQFTRVAPVAAPEPKPVSQANPVPAPKPMPEANPVAAAQSSSPSPVPAALAKLDRDTIPQLTTSTYELPANLPVAPVAPEPAPLASEPVPSTPPPAPGNASEILRQRLAEFYSFRRRRPRPAVPPDAPEPPAIPGMEPPAPDLLEATGELMPADLTGQIESQFVPGLSSVLLGLGASKKPVR